MCIITSFKDSLQVNGVDYDSNDDLTMISTLNLQDGAIIKVLMKGMIKIILGGMSSLYSHFSKEVTLMYDTKLYECINTL